MTDRDATSAACWLLCPAWLVLVAFGQTTPAWSQAALPPSIEVRVPGAYVRTSPSPYGARRGTLANGVRFQPVQMVRSSGCSGPWYRIGPEAWVCSEFVEPSPADTRTSKVVAVSGSRRAPSRYALAGADGARWYRTLEEAEYEEWQRQFDPRTGLPVKGVVTHQGRRYLELVTGGFIPAEEASPIRTSEFHGQMLNESPRVAWVVGRPAVLRAQPRGGRTTRRVPPRTALPLLDEVQVGRALWLRVGPDEWVERRFVVPTKVVSPPAGVGPLEHWIHVQRDDNVLTAYEGPRPVFSTLISAGRRGSATPLGVFRIWAKLATGDMAGEGETFDERPYLMRSVPWIMYFNEGVALHGAYWHDAFGQRRSHGCVNLAPADAAFVFQWTSPPLPPGWTEVLPARTAPGSVVVVE